MDALAAVFDLDWRGMFVPSQPLLEVFIRGSATYLALFALLRLILKRQAGGFGVTDLLLVVLIADAAQNAMAGEYHSVTEGVLLVATIIGWDYVLDWLGFHSATLRRLMQPAPLPLIEDGRLLRANMRRELITPEDLESELRNQGIESFSAVRRAFMEPDGRISVIKQQEDSQPRARERPSDRA